jgi:8-oxo-dGTP pyrophosphatase MutT (NUDIX family)
MLIEVYADNLNKQDISNNWHFASRAIVLREGKILLLHAKKYDLYMLPGGRIENNETPEVACIRELEEETGLLGKIVKKTVVIKEFFPEASWESHFFIVDVVNDNRNSVKFTEEEVSLQIEEKWFTVDEALNLLDTHDSSFHMGANIMQREFIAIINSL